MLCGGFFAPIDGVKHTSGATWCQKHLADKELYLFLEKVDADLAEAVRQQGCRHCSGVLHRGDYKRKPRGVDTSWPRDVRRHSFCCDKDGCRRRHTPPSVRFLGRRVYPGVVVVLVAAMVHGVKPHRVERLREALKIDGRTLERWRQWWLTLFVESPFWKEARARFTPPVCPKTLPWSLCARFGKGKRRDRLLDLLKFLAPITTPDAWKELVM